MDISLFMSAARPKWWKRMHQSLVGNKCQWEIVAVGPNPPIETMPDNFRYYQCDFKPCQCYAAASYFSTGELIGYCADDVSYSPHALDFIWEAYEKHGKKVILTQQTIENGKDVTEEHYFFRRCKNTPQMAPMAFLNRDWFWSLKGYDRNYICGQAENSICIDAQYDGGKIINISESKAFLNHEECHGGIWNKINYRLGKVSFRNGYYRDRRYLEECYVEDGFDTYDEKTLKHGSVSLKRLLPHHPYNYKNILTVSQGPQGDWEK